MKEKIEISKEHYLSLLRSEAHLSELENRGVDNWSGYVGPMFYCRECDNESEWYEVDGECPKCNKEIPYY